MVRPERLPFAAPTAGVGRHHGLASFAAEGLAEFGHVLHHSVDSELPGRMGIGLDL